MLSSLLIAGVVGYLLGAIPFGYLVARSRGVNIFEVGSRSPGATNVRRVLGRGAGNLVFVLDALKGAAATGWPLVLAAWRAAGAGASGLAVDPTPFALAGLVGALVGHSFSCFTRFRGGKGVATGAGGFLVLMPVGALIATAIWLMLFFAFRYVSLASMVAAASLPVSAWAFGRPAMVIGLSAVIAGFVVFRHRENCRRLLQGTENRFVKKTPDASRP